MMVRPKKEHKSRRIEVRLQIKVEQGSIEESLLNYLNDENTRPFSKNYMFMTAFLPFWQCLMALHQQQSIEQVLKALESSRYLWNLHEQYLRRQIEAQYLPNPAELLKVERNPERLCQQADLPIQDSTVIEPQGEALFNPFGDDAVFLRS